MTTRTGPAIEAGSVAQAVATPDGTTDSLAQTHLVKSLRDQIRYLETAARCDDGTSITTGCNGLDRLLPAGGLSSGTITEWLAPAGGSGAEILSLIAAREACRNAGACRTAGRRTAGRSSGALVVVDLWRQFYPPAAAAWGINLDNTIVLRGRASRGKLHGGGWEQGADWKQVASEQEFYWAIDQALRCPAVAAVWGRLDQISERWFRRFQLSAEESGAMGMFVRPARTAGQPSWSEVQWLVGDSHARSETVVGPAVLPSNVDNLTQQGQPANSFARRINTKLLRCRGGSAGAQATIQIDFTTGKLQTVSSSNETHSVHLATQLANPTPRRRSQRA